MEESVNSTTSIIQLINEIFGNIFSSVDNNIYDLLDKILFVDTKIIEEENFKKLFGVNPSNGILVVCNALILGFFIFYSINYLFSHLTYSKVQSPMQFVFKVIIFCIVMNGSYWICSQIISVVSIISSLIRNIGEELFHQEISMSNFISQINDKLYSSGQEINVTSFDGIIKSFSTIGFMNLIFSYSLRYIMIQVFVILFPFAILCLVNEKTEWVFKSLIKAMISLLLEQVLVAVIILLAFSFTFSNNDNMSKILYIGVIYALIKSNTYMYMIFGGITTSINSGIGMLSNKNL